MSEGRALTNCIGNGVATMVIAKLQGERDDERFQAVLDNPSLADPDRRRRGAAGVSAPAPGSNPSARGSSSQSPRRATERAAPARRPLSSRAYGLVVLSVNVSVLP